MLFGETVAAYCENHTEHTDTLSGKNAGFWYVKAGGIYSDHWALNGKFLLQGCTSYKKHVTTAFYYVFTNR
jgi:hypothetical protein